MSRDYLLTLLSPEIGEAQAVKLLDDFFVGAVRDYRDRTAEVESLRARVAELEAAAAPKLCVCGHSKLVHTVPEPHSCFAINQACPCPAYRQLPPAEAAHSLTAGALPDAARSRGIVSALQVIVKHGEMSDTVRQEISELIADAEAGAQ